MLTADDVRLKSLPPTPGCYVFKDAAGAEIYVGKAVNLKRRVSSYFHGRRGHPARTLRLVQEVADVEVHPVRSEVEALLLENRLIKALQPRWNVKLKDDKTYPSLAISREPFPRIVITRDTVDPSFEYFGPFSSASGLRRAYQVLMRIFQFRICTLDIREDDPGRRRYRPCLNYHIKRCSAPCTIRIDAAAYGRDIDALRTFLRGGDSAAITAELSARMKEAAAELRYEEAARARDQLQALGRLASRRGRGEPDPAAAPTIDPATAAAALMKALALPRPPRQVECFDISHLQGTEVVAACVQFIDGLPNRDGYRHFRVRGEGAPATDAEPDATAVGPRNDDTAAMAEVVARRYRRVLEEGLPRPDLILIDGGAPQVAAAVRSLAAVGYDQPLVLGLAKKEELLVRPDGRVLRLSRRDPGLRLLMYARDEAHRFCRRYHHLLRGKKLTATDAPPRRRRPGSSGDRSG